MVTSDQRFPYEDAPRVLGKELAMPSITIPDLPFTEYEAENPPKLTFTKVVTASFNGKEVKLASWNRLLDTALNYAAKEILNFEKLQNIAAVNLVKGKKLDEGYRYLPDANLSVQGQKANLAWRGVMLIAKNLKCSVEVSFMWHNIQGAEHPGEKGIMRLGWGGPPNFVNADESISMRPRRGWGFP